MVNLLFSFFLLSITFNASLLAMDPQQISYDDINYIYYHSNQPKIFRCPKQGAPIFERLDDGKWSTDLTVQYDQKQNELSYWILHKRYILIQRIPFQARQIINGGGSFQRNRGGPKATPLVTMKKPQKMTLPGKKDFSVQSIEDYLLEVAEGFEALRCDRPLDKGQTELLLSMCQDRDWYTIRMIANSDETLNEIVNFARTKQVKNITLEIHNISEAAMKNLATFIVDSALLEQVIIKAPNSFHADLILREIVKKYSRIPHLHFSMPIESDQLKLLLDAFLKNSKLSHNNTLEISNYNIDEAWFIGERKYYEGEGLTIQSPKNPGHSRNLLISRR